MKNNNALKKGIAITSLAAIGAGAGVGIGYAI
jgi:hypothetical protein